ncbi:hypothetical protein Snov_0204 [Ancylobacter novellus DSM 506]|uniref:Uncharacterized protein n=1 Tax=Ancylobacter novellus (strain ATCC 8093 / DSM 506 / JCM 20403 / CCM 1077 / IAM 12100 / NBRC 12443 / NCIMB 10456) TaxID=639283 RepID=D7A130_ANCN5|nr:hypothetical protein Snov_0204 [Ancylobacter novellus DSM 506]
MKGIIETYIYRNGIPIIHIGMDKVFVSLYTEKYAARGAPARHVSHWEVHVIGVYVLK